MTYTIITLINLLDAEERSVTTEGSYEDNQSMVDRILFSLLHGLLRSRGTYRLRFLLRFVKLFVTFSNDDIDCTISIIMDHSTSLRRYHYFWASFNRPLS